MTKHNTSNTVFAVRLINGQPAHMDIYEDKTMDEVMDILIVDLSCSEFIAADIISDEYKTRSTLTINDKPMWILLDGAYYDMFSQQPGELN